MGPTIPPKINLRKQITKQFIELNDRNRCPIMGLGTALIKEEKDVDVVYQSIKDGVRLIDTGPPNEEFVGKGIKKAIDERIVRREDLFIVTKLDWKKKKIQKKH